jgi:hypothetical protein
MMELEMVESEVERHSFNPSPHGQEPVFFASGQKKEKATDVPAAEGPEEEEEPHREASAKAAVRLRAGKSALFVVVQCRSFETRGARMRWDSGKPLPSRGRQ